MVVHTGVCECLLVSEDAYCCLRVPTGVCECLQVSEGAYLYLWVPTVA